jgi:hypothetical protein
MDAETGKDPYLTRSMAAFREAGAGPERFGRVAGPHDME